MLSLWANWLQLNSQLNSPGVSFWLYRTCTSQSTTMQTPAEMMKQLLRTLFQPAETDEMGKLQVDGSLVQLQRRSSSRIVIPVSNPTQHDIILQNCTTCTSQSTTMQTPAEMMKQLLRTPIKSVMPNVKVTVEKKQQSQKTYRNIFVRQKDELKSAIVKSKSSSILLIGSLKLTVKLCMLLYIHFLEHQKRSSCTVTIMRNKLKDLLGSLI